MSRTLHPGSRTLITPFARLARRGFLILRRRPRLMALAEAFGGWWFDIRGRRFRIGDLEFEIPREGTSRRFRARFAFGLYEYSERRMIAAHLPAGATVLELGGGFGVVACVANRRLAAPAAHVVLEANPEAVPILRRNRALNGAGFAVETAFLGDAPALDFYAKSDVIGFSHVVETGARVSVPGRTLAALEAAHGLSFDALIMDIEGGEAEAVAHLGDALARFDLAILEVHEQFIGARAAAAMRRALAAAGLARVDASGATEVWRRAMDRPGAPG